MPYQYGEIFAKLGIAGMGHQGATWCAKDPDGVLVLMAHQAYVKKRDDKWLYEMPDQGLPPSPRGPSARNSIAMIQGYFEPGKKIFLPVAVFVTDGGPRPDGTWEQSVFRHATGDVYEATMQAFEPATG